MPTLVPSIQFLLLNFVYHLDGNEAMLTPVPDDIGILVYEKAKNNQ
jgi:hypothetical protein